MLTPQLRLAEASGARRRGATSPTSALIRAKKIEERYAARLRTVARAVDAYVRGAITSESVSDDDVRAVEDVLRRYAYALEPWARGVAERMLAEVAARDDRSWQQSASLMSRELRREMQSAPTGHVLAARLQDQVHLITSLPREAAQRVRELATEAKLTGTRADVLAAKILESGDVTRARARTIARTETSRTATELTRARAEHVGSEGYVWRTAGDSDVRPSHKALNGTFHRWSEPPVCDPPDHRAHPGCIWNCRCFAQVVLPGDEDQPMRFRHMVS